jgi:tRNA A37 threonylcarbamoyladenosine biosynthesis protein TsaE
MIHTDEDDEFARIEHENKLKGQPYHYDVYVSPSQRNQVIEECAKVADEFKKQTLMDWPDQIAQAIRGLKK